MFIWTVSEILVATHLECIGRVRGSYFSCDSNSGVNALKSSVVWLSPWQWYPGLLEGCNWDSDCWTSRRVLTGGFSRDFFVTFTTGLGLLVKWNSVSDLIPLINWAAFSDSVILDWLDWDMLMSRVELDGSLKVGVGSIVGVEGVVVRVVHTACRKERVRCKCKTFFR